MNDQTTMQDERSTSGQSLSNGGLGKDPRSVLTALAHRIIAAGRTGRGVHVTAAETKLLLSNNLPCTADDPSVMDN